jgi:hypothetical protein
MATITDYHSITSEVFQNCLESVVHDYSTMQLLAIPGVQEIIQEELNNEILEYWAEESKQSELFNFDIQYKDEFGASIHTEDVEVITTKLNTQKLTWKKAYALVVQHALKHKDQWSATRFIIHAS